MIVPPKEQKFHGLVLDHERSICSASSYRNDSKVLTPNAKLAHSLVHFLHSLTFPA
jgi:hypothetical protein